MLKALPKCIEKGKFGVVEAISHTHCLSTCREQHCIGAKAQCLSGREEHVLERIMRGYQHQRTAHVAHDGRTNFERLRVDRRCTGAAGISASQAMALHSCCQVPTAYLNLPIRRCLTPVLQDACMRYGQFDLRNMAPERYPRRDERRVTADLTYVICGLGICTAEEIKNDDEIFDLIKRATSEFLSHGKGKGSLKMSKIGRHSFSVQTSKQARKSFLTKGRTCFSSHEGR